MTTIVQDRSLHGEIRVAAVFESGNIKPVWFEQVEHPSAGRIFVKKVNLVWTHYLGTATIISFAVSAADNNNYTLVLDAQELIWSLTIAEISPFR